jgi:hypothetical protein
MNKNTNSYVVRSSNISRNLTILTIAESEKEAVARALGIARMSGIEIAEKEDLYAEKLDGIFR